MDILQWFSLYAIGFWLFCADTQFWVVLGCTILGTLTAVKQRRKGGWGSYFRSMYRLGTEDAVALIPNRFSEKVLWYCESQYEFGEAHWEQSQRRVAGTFPPVWQRIVDFLYVEDKIDQSKRG